MTEYPDFHGDMPITHSQLRDSSCACGTNCDCEKNCDCTKCGCKKCTKEVSCPCGGNCGCKK